jgi:transcriptional regulator of nitric oxide reductase
MLLVIYDTNTAMLALASRTHCTQQSIGVPAPATTAAAAAAAAAAASVASESAHDDTASDVSSVEVPVEESTDIHLLAKLYYADGFVKEFVQWQNLRDAPATLNSAYYGLEQ